MSSRPCCGKKVPVALLPAHLQGIMVPDAWGTEDCEADAPVVIPNGASIGVNGGAIAMGHPLGATGAMVLGTALDELERSGKVRRTPFFLNFLY